MTDFSFYYLIGLLPDKMIGRVIGLSSAFFFIFALHNTCVLAWCGGLMNRLPLPHGLEIMIVPFMTFMACFAIYCVFKKVCPRILAVLCGGRV